MSKYRIEDVPRFKPGKCANCGASKNDGRKYIDFGLEVDWYGTVYLCGCCIKDIANNIGAFDEIKKDLDVARIALELEKKNTERIDTLNETVIRTVDELRDLYGDLSLNRQSDLFSTPDDIAGTSITEKTETGSESGTVEAKRVTPKSNPGGGSKDVPSLASLLNKS